MLHTSLKTLTTSLLMTAAASNVWAAGFKCTGYWLEMDIHRELRLEADGSLFRLVYLRQETGDQTEIVLADRLVCKTEGLMAYCHRSKEQGANVGWLVEARIVNESGLDSISQQNVVNFPTELKIRFTGPSQYKTYRFSLDHKNDKCTQL